MRRAITIKHIAEQLGLSRNTVSKALNGQYVPEKTRQLVLQKAAELGYKSLGNRQEQLSGKRYKFILLSGKPLNNMNYFIPLIKSIENSCYNGNHDLFQYVYNKSNTHFKRLADYITKLGVDGIIAIECFDKEFIDRILGLGKPICFIDFTATYGAIKGNYDIICADDRQTIFNAVVQIIKKHRIKRLTFVGDRRHCLSFRERYVGMLNAILRLRNHHGEQEDIILSDEGFNYGDINAVRTKILQLKYRPECFVCCNDFVARIVCLALKELNISVPQDTLVLGFDNVAEAHSASPTITTFSVDKEFIGRETVRTLINRIEMPSCPTRIIHITTTPVLGQSTSR